MRIKQFEEYCQPYGLDKRTIDYYSNLGLIPYTTKGAANYREYDDTSIDAVKKIVILRDVGLPLKSIKEALSNPSYFTTAVWNSHIKALKEHLAETQKKYEDMIEIIPTETLSDVLENILISGSKKDQLIEKMKSIGSKVAEKVPQSTINNPTTN